MSVKIIYHDISPSIDWLLIFEFRNKQYKFVYQSKIKLTGSKLTNVINEIINKQ